MVYHTQPNSSEVEFVGIKGAKFFKTKEKAERWFEKNYRHQDYIEAEAVEFTGFSSLKLL